MTIGHAHITVTIKYGEMEQTFSGGVEEVWVAVNKFFNELLPTFKISKTLILDVDLQRLVEECEGLIGFIDNMPHLLVSKEKLTDNETLMLHLLASYLGSRLGFIKSDALTREDLQAKLGKNPKITSTRLGELVKNEMAKKTSNGSYRITGFGIVNMQREWLPRIRTKLGS